MKQQALFAIIGPKGSDVMTEKKHLPIGVFDSGLGGISVLKELMSLMPEEHFLYFGDSANAPYGTRTTEEVKILSMNAAAMLYERGIKALVVACNTATAAAISQIREEYPNLIVVGIEPALKMATDRFPRGHVGIMATQVTLREEKLEHLVCRFPDATVEKIPAPGLVELIEAGQADSERERIFGRTDYKSVMKHRGAAKKRSTPNSLSKNDKLALIL